MDEMRVLLLVSSMIFWLMAYLFSKSENSYNQNSKRLSLSDFLFLFVIKPPTAN